MAERDDRTGDSGVTAEAARIAPELEKALARRGAMEPPSYAQTAKRASSVFAVIVTGGMVGRYAGQKAGAADVGVIMGIALAAAALIAANGVMATRRRKASMQKPAVDVPNSPPAPAPPPVQSGPGGVAPVVGDVGTVDRPLTVVQR